MDYDYYECKHFISQVEEGYFDPGPYGESFIIKDLQTRRTLDTINPSRNEVSYKKGIYNQEFKRILDGILDVLQWAKKNHQTDLDFINRLNNCKNQLEKLQNILRNF